MSNNMSDYCITDCFMLDAINRNRHFNFKNYMFNFYQPWWSIGRTDMAATGYREFETVNMKTL